MQLRGTPATPLVIIELRTFQPWPASEKLTIAGVRFERASDGDPYAVQALIEADADDDNENLYRRARASLDAAIDLLRRAISTYPMIPKDSYNIDRGSENPGVGVMFINATATLIRTDPLCADRLVLARQAALAYQNAKPTQRRRLRAAAYWLRQVDTAPEIAARTTAAFFAIEAAIGSTGRFVTRSYIQVLHEMGFRFDSRLNALLNKRIVELQQTRAKLVHYGNLESPNIQLDFSVIRELAQGIVEFKMGLPPPATFAIIDDMMSGLPKAT